MGVRSVRAVLVPALVLSGLVALAPPPAGAAVLPRYSVTDLGVLVAGGSSSATAINNLGVAVGVASSTSGFHAVRWSATGAITDLGTLPGADLNSGALAINDAGQVAGYATRTSGGYAYPARWSASGVIQDLGGPITNRLGRLDGIDPAGRTVGGQRPANSEGELVGIVYGVDGTPTELPGPPSGSTTTTTTTSPSGGGLGEAHAINARGQVVGAGYLWQAGRVTTLPGLAGGTGGAALAINIGGTAAGTAAPSGLGGAHAVLWRDGAITDLGTLDSTSSSAAKAINAAGQVVGTTDPQCSPCTAPQAWIRSPGGTMTALDSLIPAGSGWSLTDAAGINDLGQIVGSGIHDGQRHAYLLTPVWRLAVNFQPAGAAVPPGYVADTGAVFGLRAGQPGQPGQRYGWNLDISTATRERNAAEAPDQRYDTFVHLQKYGDRRWEVAVPNGTYLVHAVSGDACCTDSVFRLTAEGLPLVSGTPTASTHWIEGTAQVTVTDGRLTIGNGPGAVNDKIDYLEVIAS